MLILTYQQNGQRLPVRLVDNSGAPVTGVVAADILNGEVLYVRGNGSTNTQTLVNGVSWIEVDDVAAPGLYHIVMNNVTDVSQRGTFQWSVMPQAVLFVGSIGSAMVGAGPVWSEVRSSFTTSGTMGAIVRLLTQMLQGRKVIDPVAGTLTIYAEDGTTPLNVQDLLNALGGPGGLDAVEAGVATPGV